LFHLLVHQLPSQKLTESIHAVHIPASLWVTSFDQLILSDHNWFTEHQNAFTNTNFQLQSLITKYDKHLQTSQAFHTIMNLLQSTSGNPPWKKNSKGKLFQL
jgi:hypothetical protein